MSAPPSRHEPRPRRSRALGLAATLSLALAALAPARADGADLTPDARVDEIDFRTEVWPIIEGRCVRCHGPDKQKAGLRLDDREAALAGSFFGETKVLLPGNSAGSILLQRLVTEDEDERMPSGEEALDEAEIATIRGWIDAGAHWPESIGSAGGVTKHWAYVAPARPTPPMLPGPGTLAGWARNPIDHFTGARMVEHELAPSPEADRATLIRRASLDLTGLPPEPADVDAFVADEDPDAYERLIDRLLASPRYGEHLALFWLDLARYADTNGYEKDDRRTMWRYRDWVIESFNRDLPFDRFTIEQLAGDLLPEPTLDQLIATGFHRNTMTNKEGGVDPEEYRVAAVVDRVNTTAQVWLGSTLACAQCHNHKFDPFTQEEYFGLYAFFDHTEDGGGTEAPYIDAPTAAQRAAVEARADELDALEARLGGHTPELEAELADLEARWQSSPMNWVAVRPDSTRSEEGARLAVLDDDSVLSFGELPQQDRYEVSTRVGADLVGNVRTVRLQVMPDASLGGRGPGRAGHGNFVLNELMMAVAESPVHEPVPVALRGVRADYAQPDWAAAGSADGDPATGWAVGGEEGAAHQLYFELAEPLRLTEGAVLSFTLDQRYGHEHLIGRFRLSVSPRRYPQALPVVPPSLEPVLALGLRRDAGQQGELASWVRATSPSLDPVRARIAELKAMQRPPTTLVMRERATPRETRIHRAGSFLNPGEVVTAGVPAVLHDLPAAEGARATRLDLARWLVAPENPLTARVLVNRHWERVFGQGLVATGDDFGTQGDEPTHPELLDWLALELIEQGWSTKELLRLILTSATYRQRSVLDEAGREQDPYNVWIARGPRVRVEAETVRDIALAAAGLLRDDADDALVLGGPSVFPPQPDGIWAMTYSSDRWATSDGGERFRRGLYTFWRRTSPYPTFTIFDAPSREIACLRRSRSNTPLQALALLNDPAFVEIGAALARRILDEGGDTDDGRLAYGFRLCTARVPSDDELGVLARLLASERAHFAADVEAAAELAAIGSSTADAEGPGNVELAAWMVVANALLNLDETITKG